MTTPPSGLCPHCRGTGIVPRLFARRDAAVYLGHTMRSFEQHVERALRHVRIKHPGRNGGVYYDRLDLDRWVEEQKAADARPDVVYRTRRPRSFGPSSPLENELRERLLRKLGRSPEVKRMSEKLSGKEKR